MEKKEGRSSIKPQEIITLIRNMDTQSKDKNLIEYLELNEYYENGYYVEDFKLTLINADKYMITFSLRKFNPSTY